MPSKQWDWLFKKSFLKTGIGAWCGAHQFLFFKTELFIIIIFYIYFQKLFYLEEDIFIGMLDLKFNLREGILYPKKCKLEIENKLS